MEITISFIKRDEKEIIQIKSGKYLLEALKGSEKWNSDTINEFLINVICSIPENEKLTINADKEIQNESFIYIKELFEELANEYNKSIRNN